ncbi:hypothetical protein [Comamonas sp. NyZ500]|uniref:hypothetical protein n=1 Tax=Comamonas sp. NyZ500 TaxID=2795732 RepID=UPI001ED8C4B3|nr:hypothetical protein [Comamonas sp. NyZ500]
MNLKDSMNCNDLFAHLIQRFKNYPDAAVLWVLLKAQAEKNETSFSIGDISHIELCDTLPKTTVQRAIHRLHETGFISVRAQKNTRTLISVNREAVLSLLRTPLAERLPILSKKHFPFIDAWNEDIAKQAAQVAIENASADEGGKSGEVPDAG